MTRARLGWLCGAALALSAAAPPPAPGRPVVLKIGTVAPEASPWHDVLVQMGQDWKRISQGQVTLHVHAGGVLGEELDMIKRVRIGGLQGVAISSVGLHHVEPAVSCLQIPMMFDSYAELDHVRDSIAPRLEAMIEKRGFLVLNWGDAGWVHFFSKTPAATPEDIRKMRLFISAGDAEALDLYKSAGMRPQPLALTDVLTGLQTGMIEAFDVPPLMALLNQWFALAPHMIEVKWAPLIGATLVSKSAWEKVPEAHRPALREAARAAGEKFRTDIRRLSDEAVEAMKKKGLKTHPADAALVATWRREAEAIYPKLRGPFAPADLFDEVRRLRDEFRSGKR